MDAPVVVKPDAVSKSASIKLGILPDITNGRAPNILRTIQLRATITNPSLANMERFFLPVFVSGIPIKRQISIHSTKTHLAGSL